MCVSAHVGIVIPRDDDTGATGFYILVRPEHKDPSFFSLLMAGYARAPFMLGRAAFKRMMLVREKRSEIALAMH